MVKKLKKKKLHDMLRKGFQEVEQGKTISLTQKLLDSWVKKIDILNVVD